MIPFGSNAVLVGFDLLFVLMWVAAWGIADYFISEYTKTKFQALIVYIVLFLSAFTTLLFIYNHYSI